MKIKRIDSYSDLRFSEQVLVQHGGFLVNEEPYEVEIISDHEAVVRGREVENFPAVIEEFRFFTPHISVFYDEKHSLLREYPFVSRLKIDLADIQPSQFYVDSLKVQAVSTFIHRPEDIVIQVIRHGNRYISLDGHTRLFLAVQNGWKHVLAVEEPAIENYVSYFVDEAQKRGIMSPYDLTLLEHNDYEEKWNGFCDIYFSNENEKE